MRRSLPFLCALALLSGAVRLPAATNESAAAATLVLYNKAVPDSVALAKFYAQQRNIPRDHLVALNCSTEEEISRQDYDATIAGPVRQLLRERKWWTLRGADTDQPSVVNSSI